MIMNHDKFKDECGVVAVYGNPEASKLAYLCLYAQQHRGQQSAGIAASDGSKIKYVREHGLVADVFTEKKLKSLVGNIAIGHNRYPTDGNFSTTNLQPVTAELPIGDCALAYNGNLINSAEIKRELISKGSIFSTTTDSEPIMHLLAKELQKSDVVDGLAKVMNVISGAYSLVFMTGDTLIAMRDPNGIRPLALGKLKGGYVIVSETVALDLIDASFIREVEPGEMIIITPDSMRSIFPFGEKAKPAPCIFEHIYFARPDSYMFGKYVYEARKAFGRTLAEEHPIDADVVIPVPDSGIIATLGYSEASGIPMEMGLIRNHYVGRTFIEPTQSIRDFGVKVKLNPIKSVIEGKRIVVVDDSIVRGTTSRKIVKMLRDAGAKEIHMRISSPPTMFPCFYGIATPTNRELISNTHTIDEVRSYIGADTLGYLSHDGMLNVFGENPEFCSACFTNDYPVDPSLLRSNS